MHRIRLSTNFVPVSEFKANAADLLKALASRNEPLVVTQNGRPAAVMLSPLAFDELAHQANVLAAIHEGLEDEAAGRVVDHETAVARLRARFPG